MNARVPLLLSIACYFAPAYAGDIYKCKGKNGEVVFTNIQCPDAASTQHIGSYQAVPDDARNQRQAAAFAESEHERLTAPRTNLQTYDGGETYDASATTSNSRAPRNSLSEHYRMQNDKLADPTNDRTATGSYVNDLADGYRNKNLSTASRNYNDNAASSPPLPSPTPQPAPGISDCRSGPSGNVTCYDTAGNASFGNTRNGAVFDSNGTAQYLQRDGNGQLKSDNGTCVKDIYGKCQ